MEILQDVTIPACSPRPMNQHSLPYQQWVRGLGTAEPGKSSWIWLSTWRDERTFLSGTRSKWVIGDEAAPLPSPRARQCRLLEELQVEGSAASRSWDVSGGVRNPIVSVCWSCLFTPRTSFRGYSYPTTWEGSLSHWEIKNNHAEKQRGIKHLERKERNHVCNSLVPLEQPWVLWAHWHPESNPANPAGLTPALLCRDTAAFSSWAAGWEHPRKQKPLASHGQPSVPLFPGSLGPASAVKHHFLMYCQLYC